MSTKRFSFFRSLFLITAAIAVSSLPAHAEKLPNGEVLGDVEFGTEYNKIPFSRASYPPKQAEAILNQYQHLDPGGLVPTEALRLAVLNFHFNLNIIKNRDFLTVIDFSQHSGQRRFFVINMNSGATEAHHVAHGQGSDQDHDGFAERFSNVNGSLASSLGFYLTAESYYGKNGFSMRLDGLEETNSRARERAIVIHGADYVHASLKKMGRSWGCPALAQEINRPYIQKTRQGSLILAWIPSP